MNEERKNLFSEKVSAGGRTYFFDVKESVKGTKYLVVTESKKVKERYEQSRVFVFEEDLGAFTDGLKKALGFIQGTPTD